MAAKRLQFCAGFNVFKHFIDSFFNTIAILESKRQIGSYTNTKLSPEYLFHAAIYTVWPNRTIVKQCPI